MPSPPGNKRRHRVGVFKRGGIDLITMHSSDIMINLVADGYAMDPQPWARNDMIIVGPTSDPAGIKGMTDAAAALKKIVATKSKFIVHSSLGAQEVLRDILDEADIELDEGTTKILLEDRQRMALKTAEDDGSYTIIGRIPFLSGKIPSEGMAAMVAGDPRLQRGRSSSRWQTRPRSPARRAVGIRPQAGGVPPQPGDAGMDRGIRQGKIRRSLALLSRRYLFATLEKSECRHLVRSPFEPHEEADLVLREFAAVLMLLFAVPKPSLGTPVSGQVDTFQDGSVDGWGGGDALTNVPDGGPAGVGDAYMQMVSGGSGGMGGSLATYNLDDRWLGNYPFMGIFALSADLMAPTSNTTSPLSIRVALFGPEGSRWTSATPFALPADGDWHHAIFYLAAADMVQVADGAGYEQTMENVSRIMFRHAVTAMMGATVYSGTMAIDNITAVPPLAGDATGDFQVNGDDYARHRRGLCRSTLTGYNNGDFNFDGVINADDYFIIDRSYAEGGIPLDAASALQNAGAAVPEPAAAIGNVPACKARHLREGRGKRGVTSESKGRQMVNTSGANRCDNSRLGIAIRNANGMRRSGASVQNKIVTM